MNTPPANLNPVSPAPSQGAKGKPQEAAAETPFSQVLSGEIAQNRRAAGTGSSAGSGAEAQDGARPAKGEASDSTGLRALTGAADARADNPVIAAAYDLLRADARAEPRPDAPVDAALVLAMPLPIALDGSRLATPAGAARGEAPADADVDTAAIGQEPKKGALARALQAAQTEQSAGPARPAQETAAKGAAGFATQLAAVQQNDGARSADALSGFAVQAGLKQAEALAEPAAAQPAPLSNRLQPTVGTAAWGQALGEKVVWMAAGAQQTASLTLNPPNLGPLQVVLNVSNDQATASFFSAQPEVRQALEAAFPRLREMMNEAGIQLGQTTVSAETPQQQAFDTPAERRLPASGSNADAPAQEAVAVQTLAPRAGRGLVDTFA